MLEKNEYIGGATASLELHKNWKYSNCSYVCSLFRPEIYQSLDLGRHGLEVVPLQGSVTFKQDGDYLGSYHQSDLWRREVARHSKKDADAAVRFDADLMKWCRLIRGFLLRTPPDPEATISNWSANYKPSCRININFCFVSYPFRRNSFFYNFFSDSFLKILLRNLRTMLR